MLPFVLVLGVATTLSSISDNLSHSTTSRLSLKSFQSQPSVYFLNNTLNEVDFFFFYAINYFFKK